MAAAGTLVLIAGGIDLSVGAVYGLAGATAAQLAVSVGTPVAIAAGDRSSGWWSASRTASSSPGSGSTR